MGVKLRGVPAGSSVARGRRTASYKKFIQPSHRDNAYIIGGGAAFDAGELDDVQARARAQIGVPFFELHEPARGA